VWIREHGDANKMSLVSTDEMTASGTRVHVVKCGACSKEIRVQELKTLLRHVDNATHVAALERGPETKISAWIREHGGANTMSLASNEISAGGKRVRLHVVKCGTCSKDIRVQYVSGLLRHVDCAAHVSALEPGLARHMAAPDVKTLRPAFRKRPRC
jgi:hypothetical protein